MRVKYPRTLHLPWSPGGSSDDKYLDYNPFEGKVVVVTEKMDGENTTLYTDGLHARSTDSAHHPSRAWVKGFWAANIQNKLWSSTMRICGENMYARHSIAYEDLESYFLGFSAWEGDYCWGWDETQLIFDEFNITPVPVLFYGPYADFNRYLIWPREGYVIRLASGFEMKDFQTSVAKYVRPNHVQANAKHWASGHVIPNRLRSERV